MTRTWVLRWVVLREALVLQHVQQRSFARIVKAQEQDLRILVCQTWAQTGTPEFVHMTAWQGAGHW